MILSEADPDLGEVPLEVQFFVEPMLEIDEPRYEWDFGDGSPPVWGDRPTHTYHRPGTYNVRVRAFDKHGNLGDDQLVVDVELP
jgi:PKD repeat protein